MDAFRKASPAILVVDLKRPTASRELARKHAPEAIQTLANIAKKGTPGARISAAIALLDRAYGKPPQFNHQRCHQLSRKAVDMSDDELAAIAARAKLTVVTTG